MSIKVGSQVRVIGDDDGGTVLEVLRDTAIDDETGEEYKCAGNTILLIDFGAGTFGRNQCWCDLDEVKEIT